MNIECGNIIRKSIASQLYDLYDLIYLFGASMTAETCVAPAKRWHFAVDTDAEIREIGLYLRTAD
jgi:hypothetical protein